MGGVEMLADIVLVVLWCFAVFVCVFDWEDVREAERMEILKKRRK